MASTKGLTEPAIADIFTNIHSLEHANQLASFPVRMPSSLPDGFQLESWLHIWPGHVAEAHRASKTHADFVGATYVDASGHYFHVLQGFICLFYYWATMNPPVDSSNVLRINNKDGVWVTAYPVVSDRSVDGSSLEFDWVKDELSYVGWLDAVHVYPSGSSSDRYYGLLSDKLTVEELAQIARTVPMLPLSVEG